MLFDLLRLLVRLQWPLRLVNPIFGRYNPFLYRNIADPYPQYRALREHAPVYAHPLFKAVTLSRHADIGWVLKDPRFSVDRFRQEGPNAPIDPFTDLGESFKSSVRSALLMVDPPDHTRIRDLVNKAFTPRRVDALRPRIQSIVDELLDQIATQDDVDLVRDFAVPLPVIVISELLGVDAEDRHQFKRWSTVLGGLLDPIGSPFGLAELEASFEEMTTYFDRVFEDRRRSPRDDLISALVAAEDAGDALSRHELLAVCALILGAGHETTTNLIANSFVALLRNPGERKRLTQDRGLIETAVEEFLRYDSPVQVTDRVATQELEIAGQKVRKGQFTLLLLGAGNRDPEQFEEPDRLDLGRADNRHLSFSQGVHFCLGAQLARAEGQIAIGSVLERFPDFSGPPDPPGWKSSFVLRGPQALPLRLDG